MWSAGSLCWCHYKQACLERRYSSLGITYFSHSPNLLFPKSQTWLTEDQTWLAERVTLDEYVTVHWYISNSRRSTCQTYLVFSSRCAAQILDCANLFSLNRVLAPYVISGKIGKLSVTRWGTMLKWEVRLSPDNTMKFEAVTHPPSSYSRNKLNKPIKSWLKVWVALWSCKRRYW